jgi:hypothetical protein
LYFETILEQTHGLFVPITDEYSWKNTSIKNRATRA